MRPSTELFELIKSLSKSEKRFFKLSSSLQSGEKNYLKIFDAIDKQSSYDEDAIKKQFKGQKFIKHFPSEKNHLYKLILKSLRAYYADHSVSSILRQEIKNVEILYKKALFKECNKFVNRAKQMAIQYEKFYYLFELISWEKQLLEEAYESGNFDTDLDQLIREETECIEKLRNLAEYQVLYSRINFVFRRGGFARNAEEKEIVAEIANNHLIKGKNTALSSRAASICYYIKGLCAATNRNYKESEQHFSRVRQILDDNELIRPDLAKRYIRTLNHLLYCHIDSRDFNKAFDLVETMRSLTKEEGFDTIAAEVMIFTNTHLAELQIYERLGDFAAASERIPVVSGGLGTYGDKITKEQEILFYYHISVIEFGNGNYNDALQWINRVLNDNEKHLRQDIYSFARLLNLIIHFELGNYDLLEYIIKSTQRYLNKKDKDYKVENVILKHLRKLIKEDESERRKLYEKMQEELDKAFEQSHERVVLDYFDISSWVSSKLNEKEYSEIKKELSVS